VGAVAVSKALEPLAPWGYGVATVDEGAELRLAGITRPVLVFMTARPDLFGAYRAHRLTPALGDAASIHAWIARGAEGGAFHLEIDTGMSRSGVRWDEIEPIADLVDTPYLEGCYTHFHSADRQDGSAEAQLQRARDSLECMGSEQARIHIERLQCWREALRHLTGRDPSVCPSCGGQLDQQPLAAEARGPPETAHAR
jgi:alanine racemase